MAGLVFREDWDGLTTLMGAVAAFANKSACRA